MHHLVRCFGVFLVQAVLPTLSRVVALIPMVAIGLVGASSQFPLGGTSILIMVGVGLDTVKQIESQLQQRNYEGFLR